MCPELFEKSILKTATYWLYCGYKNKKGYAPITDKKYHTAHRYSYSLYKGEIPEGMLVCHSCDVPACVNPNHLWLGTNLENQRDRKAKGRSPRGEKSHFHKLTEKQALKIKYLRNVKKLGVSHIGKFFGIHHGHVSRIARGIKWGYL